MKFLTVGSYGICPVLVIFLATHASLVIDKVNPDRKVAQYDNKARQSGSWNVAPYSLEVLCGSSDVIVVGKVSKIIREAHTPYEHNGMFQHTAFSISPETILKDKKGRAPQIVVVQNQGNLPWKSAEGQNGIGYRIDGEPMLQLGQRYILFLKDPYTSPSLLKSGVVSATVDGVTGRSGELGELILAFSKTYAQIALKSGKTELPVEPNREVFQQWKFKVGDVKTVFGLPEKQAIALIRTALNSIAAPDKSS